MGDALVLALQAAREAEKGQALFYRALAAAAEEREDGALSERFNELHADEQHHVSRITARLLELGAAPAELGHVRAGEAVLEGWEAVARVREAEEVRRYEALLAGELDGTTEAVIRTILDAERHHAEELGGKWTSA